MTRHENADAMAEIFEQIGALGMVIEDPQLIADYIKRKVWDHYAVEIPDLPPGMINVKAYLPVDQRIEERLSCLQQTLDRWERATGVLPHTCQFTDLQEEDWAHAWKRFFKPEKVGHRVVICPSWEMYQAQPEDLVVTLDPGMAFGTGTHPTTVMCIQALEDYLQSGDKVVDVGTGSGVLAVVAALLGAGRVWAVDNDPVAVKVAKENVANNRVNSLVTVSANDLVTGLPERADIIVANIIADVILRLAPQAAALLPRDKIFIASGIIQHRLEDVVAGIKAAGFSLLELRSHGEWAAVVARRE